jgi:PKD domain
MSAILRRPSHRRCIRVRVGCLALVAPALILACGSYSSDYPVVVANGHVHAIRVFAESADMGTVAPGQTAEFTLRLSDIGYNTKDITGNPTSPTPASAVTFSATDLTTGAVACFQQGGTSTQTQGCKPTIVTHLTTYVQFQPKDFCTGGSTNNATCDALAPVADFVASPSPAPVGGTVLFNAAASHAVGSHTLVRYIWNFGDAAQPTPGSGVTATHVYASAGTYNVTLTVVDDGGQQATKSDALTVVAPAAR